MNTRRFAYLFLVLFLVIAAFTQSAANANFLSPLTIDLSFTDEANPPFEPTVVTIYIKADATGANNGTNWTDAYTDLQDALAAATAGDEIWVAEGTHKPTDNGDRMISFRLKNGVAIYGGFKGTETARNQRQWELNPTILSGDLSENDNHNVNHDEPTRADNSYHVVTASGTDESTVLDGFTISGGNANGSDPDSHGGGMFNDNSHPKLHDLAFTSNSARTNGGGMYNHKSNPTISGVAFTYNSAGSDGGGMLNTESSPSLKDVAFRHNSAQDGGGMFNFASSPTLEQVIFANNSVSPGSGGGMLNTISSAPTLILVTFNGNTAASDGGGLYNNGNSDPTLTSVIFNGNSSVLDGGGMFNLDSDPTLNNTLFTGNFAQDGGALLNLTSNPTIVNATFSGNSASNNGGGIYNVGKSHSTISNSILWNNKDHSGTGASAQISGSTSTVTYSLVQGGFAGTGNRDANPLFVESINPDDAPTIMGDFHLQPNSPAIDAGNNNTVPADTLDLDDDSNTSELLPWDLDRSNRFQDHTMPDIGNGSAPLVDMGAYETGSIIYVKADAAGMNDGSSWVDAYTDLQDGLEATTVGNEIWVATGTYKPTDDGDRTHSFWLKNGVRLYGGFNGTETAHSQRDWETNQTILSGDLDGNDNDSIVYDEPTRAENSYHVLRTSSIDHTARVDGFKITNGNGSGPDHSADDDGGGMRNDSSSPILSHIIFENNSAIYASGMFNAYGSSPTLINVTFDNNVASETGGMFNHINSNPTLYHVTFTNNKATVSHAGGMYNHTSYPILNKVTFMDNSAVKEGGGLLNTKSRPIIIDSTFSNNVADHGGGMYNRQSYPIIRVAKFIDNIAGYGGGMFNNNSNPIVSNTSFTGNSVPYYGAGMYNISSNPQLDDVAFNGNRANGEGSHGGGMYNKQSYPIITDATFTNNVADFGGGMFNTESNPMVNNTSFTGNSVSDYGGGMYNRSSSPQLYNATFTDNQANGKVTHGGGMYNNQSHPIITDATFTNNVADFGGGMFNTESNPTLSNTRFTGNSVSDYGGGIYNRSSNPQLDDVAFTGNQANGEGKVTHGGGMYNSQSHPIITDATFTNNVADYGGGMFNTESNPTVSNTSFTGNSVSNDGGGMYNRSSNAEINNVIMTGNSAIHGGGAIYSDLSHLKMSHVTISGNVSEDSGGGIINRGSNVTISNSILWNNKDNSGTGSNAQIYNLNGSTRIVTYSIVQGGWEGEGNIDTDPLFVSPINPDDAPTTSGDFRLQLGSPAIDAGSNALLPVDTHDLDGDGDTSEPIPYDLDGNPRIVNGTVDMGVYEFQIPSEETPSDLTLSKTVSSQEAQPGDTLTYRIELSATPEEVELSDTLPAGLSYVESSLPSGASYDPATKQIRYTGTVSPDAPLVIEYQVTVDSDVALGSILYNAVVVTGTNILLEDAVAVSIPEDSFNGTLVLLYVNGDNDLSEYMLDLVNRAEQAAGNEQVKVLLLLDGPDDGDTYLYRLEEDHNLSCPNYSNPTCDGRYVLGKNLSQWRENIASGHSLSEFLKGAAQAYPQSKQIILSLVGHGGGWAPTTPGGQTGKGHGVQPGGLLWDDHFGSELSTTELGQALSWFQQATGRKIDLLYLDACLMAMFEVAYEISGSVDYLLASESWSWTSFSYDAHLNAIDDTMSAREIGEAWLANEANVLRPDDYPFTYSLVDLSQMTALREALDSLATALSATLPDNKDKIDEAFKNSDCFDSDGNGSIVQTSSSEPLDTYCDLVSFASQLQTQFNGQSAVVNAAQAVKEAVKEAVVAEDHHSGIPWQHSKEHWQWEELGGLSIYLPLLEDEWARGYYNSRHLRSAKDGQWDEFLTNAYWNNAEPPEAPACSNSDCEPEGPWSIAPIHLQASSGHDSINVEWDLEGSLEGMLDHYSLYRNRNGGPYNIIASDIETQQYRDEALTRRDEYCYYVQAFNDLNRPIGLSSVACVQFGTLRLFIPNQSLPSGAKDELVSVNLANGNGLCIGAMDLVIHYDQTIANATGTISPTVYSQGYDLQADVSTPGQIRISLLNDNECEELYGAGSLFDIGFDINGEEGRSMELHFVSSEASIYSHNDLSNPLDLELENGSLTINESFIKGDANGHNKVETVDALLALRMASGKITPMFKQHTACDVNGDNDCTSADALLIRCYVFKNNWNQCGGSESPNLQSNRRTNESVKLAIGQIEGQPQAGQTVTVPVALKNAPNFAGGDFTFVYDASQMSATGASLTSLTNDFRLQSNNQEAGILRVSMASRDAIGADGDILQLEFTINSGASKIDFGSIRLNDGTGRDFETSALQQKIEKVAYQSTPTNEPTPGSNQLYLPLVIR